ncbi:MAG: FAD-dependent oxidoreductase [Flavobacteriales bacterium]|nr:MAG: FAD-dependent oxidoreductase [Flavobacteriales bacterium]
MQVDYIIVGLGLAGIAFAETLERNNKSFVVFDSSASNASKVAGGMYNPIILKRLSLVYDARSQMETALPFYRQLEKNLKIKIDYPLDIYKIFQSVSDQNNWFTACSHPLKSEYLMSKIIPNKNPAIKASFGFGQLTGAGRIAARELISSYKKYLHDKNLLRVEQLNYADLKIENTHCTYTNIISKKVVFCEGHAGVDNPFFTWVPLKRNKGELITIYAPHLQCKHILKAGVFVIPLGNDIYNVGATYNREETFPHPTVSAKTKLEEKLKKMIQVPYEIINHKAGIRPVVRDRRPILGTHPEYNSLVLLNGMGSRGVMSAPKMANLLFKNLEEGIALPKELDIRRFVS